MTSLTRPLLAALIFALLAPLSQVRGDDFAFVTVYATGHQTWALKNSYTDTLLVFYNVVTKPEGQVVTVNASNYVNAGSSNDTLISSDSYNLVITNVLKNVPEITSTLGIVAEINRFLATRSRPPKAPGRSARRASRRGWASTAAAASSAACRVRRGRSRWRSRPAATAAWDRPRWNSP